MSNTAFVELASTDPVEQAIARKVVRLLNDRTLDRQRRIELVQRAQHELLSHRRRQAGEAELMSQARSVALPKGYRAQSVQVQQGRVQVGASSAAGFAWIDAGQAPAGVAPNQAPRPLKTARKAVKRARIDPIAARRRERQGDRPRPAAGSGQRVAPVHRQTSNELNRRAP